MNDHRAFGFDRPRERRGILPLILASMGLGVVRGAVGAIGANQQRQRMKGYLSDAYRQGVARLNVQQNDVRESTSEDLARRGLMGGGLSPIQRAMAGEVGTSGVQRVAPIAASATSHDLAGATTLRNEREFDIDRHDLDSAYQKDLNDNNANAMNAEIGSIAGGVSDVAGAYGAGQQMQALSAIGGVSGSSASASGGASPIASAVLSGSSFGGIHPVDPLNDASSSWHVPRSLTINGAGLSNSDFNTSGVG